MATMPAPESQVISYALQFPSELDADQVTAWLHSLRGLLPGVIGRLWGAPSVVLELRATADHGFRYRLTVPRAHADYVVGQLRAQLPGVRVTPEQVVNKNAFTLTDNATKNNTNTFTAAKSTTTNSNPFTDVLRGTKAQTPTPTEGVGNKAAGTQAASGWTQVIELGMRQLNRSLRVDAVPLAGSLLASLQGFALHRGEVILVQWIIRPAVPETPPAQQAARPVRVGFLSVSPHVPVKDAVADRRNKLASVNFLAVLRVGVRAGSDARAGQLISQVTAAFKSVSTTANGLRARPVLQSRLRSALDNAKVPFQFHMQLTAAELAGLLAWPIGSPHVAGLPQARSRHLPPSGTISRSGLVVARSNFPGAERPLAIAPKEACKHLHIVGPTGVGKTVVLGNLVAQAMRAGNPVIVMDRKGGGGLFEAALGAVPRERLEDVIVMDVGDSHPVGFNLLSEGNSRIAVEELCQLFEHLYPDMRRGIWARAALHRGLMTLITRPGSSFIDLVPLLSPNSRSETEAQWRDELIAEVDDPELKRFWERFNALTAAQQENFAAPILDRVWQLNERPEIRHIIGQSESSFTMREAIRSRKVLLVNLAGIGAETARLTGTLLMNAIWSAVRSGACDPNCPTLFLLDEFQEFMQLPVDVESMLVQARGYGLAMVLAHQHLDQLSERIRPAVLTNARSKVVFQTTYDDARVFAKEFGRSVTDEDFMNLGKYEVLCRFAGEDGVSAPVTGETLKPTAPTALGSEARERSRRRYGRDPAAIQADIAQRRTPREAAKPKKRPRLGGVKWE